MPKVKPKAKPRKKLATLKPEPGSMQKLMSSRALVTAYNVEMLQILRDRGGKSARGKANQLAADALMYGNQPAPELL